MINGLVTYDKRHGYRGPEQNLAASEDAARDREAWLALLNRTAVIAGLQPAIVTALGEDRAALLMADGSEGELLFENGVAQARPYRGENSMGPAPENIASVLQPGDLIRVTPGEHGLQLAQVPAAQAALVSLRAEDGAILSVVGGMGFELSKFNRATQAQRQPGSNFKPFLYAAAMESGFTAASMINDAPVVLEDCSLEDIWRPENDSGKFYGPTRLRLALTKSRNLVSIRLLQQLGVRPLIEYSERLGFDTSNFTRDLSLALGTHTMSPMQVARGYAVLANGGYRVEPYLIERIEDVNGEVLYEATPLTVCRECEQPQGAPELEEELSMEEILAQDSAPGERLPEAPRVMDERVNFIINSVMRDVITRGTGRRALVLERTDIGGKTGTTNGPMDAWFSGYNGEVVTTTWVGFDNYPPLGRREFGGTAALPIWIEFMREALGESRPAGGDLPPGVVHVRIDPVTGRLAATNQPGSIFEYFREENTPAQDGSGAANPNAPTDTDSLIDDIF